MSSIKKAPGKPGSRPAWTTSQKTGVGCSVDINSRVWFTLSHGILNEVYFPTVDIPNTRDLQFIVTDGKSFFSEEKRDCNSVTKNIEMGTGGYFVTNTCLKKQYQIKKTIFTNPYNSTLIQEVEFTPLVKKPFRLFALLAPHMQAMGANNTAFIESYKGCPMLCATRNHHYYLTLSPNEPFINLSCGFVGVSDGYTELKKNKYLKNKYEKAEGGTVALTGEIDLTKGYKFRLYLSFGHSFEEASKTLKATIFHNHNHLFKKFKEGWKKTYQNMPSLSFLNKEAKNLYLTSIMVLNSHLGKEAPGNVIASLSIPWGTSKGDQDLGGYHLIWPRDLVEISGGFIASGDHEEARLILHFLASIQEEDGHFAQCLWHSGKPYWTNVQMDETALPVILAGTLKEKKALKWLDPWPLVEKAVKYLLKNGPVTPQDRWEEDGGYTPFTLACEISALLIGADFFQEKGFVKEAKYIREIADYWNAQIEKWIYATDTKLCKKLKIDGYYVRITPDDQNPKKTLEIIELKNRPPENAYKPACEIVSCDTLALVRFGLRSARDPKIKNTLKVIDHLLKKETKFGPTWRRYNEDGYGEHKNGDSFNGTGIGRGWPLLAAERAHYEIAAKNFKQAKNLIKAIIAQSGENYLIPEQIWDEKDIPKKLLLNGKPTRGAMPLVWAHAEYLKLIKSLNEKKIYDCPKQTQARYLNKKNISSLVVWKPNHKLKKAPLDKILRIELFEDASITYQIKNKKSNIALKPLKLGVYYTDINLKEVKNSYFEFSIKKHSSSKTHHYKIELF